MVYIKGGRYANCVYICILITSKCFFNRHPLQELCVGPFVPNDACLDLEHGKIKILTGPNASGKSVYLKQVCYVVMDHI